MPQRSLRVPLSLLIVMLSVSVTWGWYVSSMDQYTKLTQNVYLSLPVARLSSWNQPWFFLTPLFSLETLQGFLCKLMSLPHKWENKFHSHLWVENIYSGLIPWPRNFLNPLLRCFLALRWCEGHIKKCRLLVSTHWNTDWGGLGWSQLAVVRTAPRKWWWWWSVDHSLTTPLYPLHLSVALILFISILSLLQWLIS